jgi:hypothetical protein
MILDYASDYIAMGDSLPKKQSYLNAACTAWNIASLPKHQRKKALKKYLASFRRYNPEVRNTADLEHDLQLLIKRKNELFPEVRKIVANAEIQERDGRYTIAATSANLDAAQTFLP